MAGGDHLPIDTRLLEPFVVLAEELHFTHAAERLHVAQPALSQQIGRLERQLGTRLFTRPPQPIALTPAGHALLGRARPALADLGAAVEEARAVAAGRRGRLTVAHLRSFARLIPAIAGVFRDEHRDVTLSVREGSVEDQLESLRAHEVDVGLFHLNRDISLDDQAIALDLLASGPQYVALPLTHELATERSVSLERLSGETWIMPSGVLMADYQAAIFVATCTRHGFAPRIGRHASTIETMLGLVAAGLGIAMAPWPVALRPPPGLAFAVIRDERVDIVAARAGHPALASEGFVTIARRVVGQLVGGTE